MYRKIFYGLFLFVSLIKLKKKEEFLSYGTYDLKGWVM